MAGRRGRRTRTWLSTALATAVLGVLVGGCSLGTGDEKKRAGELAEKRYPGRLTVIGARTLFPETSGSEVMFSVADDPDAVVRLRMDAKKKLCEGKDCGRALDDAVDKGTAQAASWRAMRASFAHCGREVIGTDDALGEPWLVADLTDETVTDELTDIGECARDWAAARAESARPKALTSVSVNIVSSDVARDRPKSDHSRPTVLRMTDGRLQAALAAHRYFTVDYPIKEGTGHTVDPAAAGARIVWPFKERDAFGKTARAAARDWLHKRYPHAVVRPYTGIWTLRPGTIDRLTGYVLFCETQLGRNGPCEGEHGLAVTTDPQGNPVGDFRLIRDVRDDNGLLDP